MDERKVVIELQNVKRYFQVGSETVKALRGVSFKIYEGEFVTIQGTSGSGKSTLLNQLGCLDTLGLRQVYAPEPARLSGYPYEWRISPRRYQCADDVEDQACPSP